MSLEFPELIKVRATEDLQEAAVELLAKLNQVATGGNFSGTAVCYAVPLAQIVAEIGRRKRYVKPTSEAAK